MTTLTSIRARAWTGGRVERVHVMVEDGRVTVWDGVAGHYTACHSLGRGAIRRARAMAAQASE